MERVEIIASEGCKLTQNTEIPADQRIYVSRVYTNVPNDWKDAPIEEYEQWLKIKQEQYEEVI